MGLFFVIRSPGLQDTLNPYTFLYINDKALWTAPAPGASGCAAVGRPSNFERLWAPADLFYRITIGPDGSRGSRFGPRPAGAGFYRVLLVGDSTAFGYFVDDEFVFPALAESISRLVRSRPRLEVLNFAAPGFSSEQALRRLRRTIDDLSPDMVLCCAGTNDARDTATRYPASLKHLSDMELLLALDDAVEKSKKGEDPCTILESSMGGKAGEILNKKSGIPRVRVESYERNIEEIARLAEISGAEPVLLLNGLVPGYRAAAEKIIQKNGVAVIDCDSLFSAAAAGMEGGTLFPRMNALLERRLGTDVLSENRWLRRRIDACHPNRFGHYIIALELVRLATGAQLSSYGTAEGLHAGFDLVFSGNRRAGWSKLADSFPGSTEPFLRIPDSGVFTGSDAAADPAVMLESAEILRQQGKYASAERLLSRAAAEYGEWRAISTVRRNLAASRTASLTGRSETGAQPAAQSATATAFPRNSRHAALASILPGYGAFSPQCNPRK